MTRRATSMVAIAALAMACSAAPQLSDPQVAANAPEDKPYFWSDLSEMDRVIAPYVAQARASYPEAKARYVAGLPPGQSFFVTVTLRDARGKVERVFLFVDRIAADRVYGRIWNHIDLVEGFTYRQAHSVPEMEVLDWTITRPDGTEEGNIVGKFVDALHEQPSP